MTWFDVVKQTNANTVAEHMPQRATPNPDGFAGNVGRWLANRWKSGAQQENQPIAYKNVPDIYRQTQYERGAEDPYHRKKVGAELTEAPEELGDTATEKEKKEWQKQMKRYKADNKAARQSAHAEAKEYQKWMKEQRSLAGKNADPNLDTNDPMAQSAAKRGFKAFGRGLKEWTGYGWGGRTGKEGRAADKNLEYYRQQMDAQEAEAAKDTESPSETPEQTQTPTGGEYGDLLEAARQLPQATPQQVAPETELPASAKDQLKDPNVPEPDWEGDMKQPTTEEPERDWSKGFSEEVGHAPLSPEELAERERTMRGPKEPMPKSLQPKLGRGDWRHTLPKDHPDYVPFEEINIGRFHSPASVTASSTNLSRHRLDDAQGYDDNRQPDGGVANLAQHDERVEELRRPKPEPKGKETTLEEYQS